MIYTGIHIVCYSIKKKKQSSEKEKQLEIEITFLETSDNVSDLEILENKKQELVELRKLKLKGAVIRSRANWIENGEHPTKYFCNLESRHFYDKLLYCVELENGQRVYDQNEILKETRMFYKKLYSNKNTLDDNLLSKIEEKIVKKLSDAQSEQLEGKILFSELSEVLKNTKNDKSPGSDGFTIEFFKFFWIDLGLFVLRHINYSYECSEMSTTQKTGVITLIPKQDKDKLYLKNWRPITLLNSIYKLASACIANRIKNVLSNLISKDQTGFVKNRYIGENTRLVYDIINYCEYKNIPGLLVLVDFEKAFDSISWSFVGNVLDFFNFKSSIKKWINTFYNKPISRVSQNGYLSEPFVLERGCRQGDPLSPYIFILCAEILSYLIKSEKSIHGIKINGLEHVISQYADDTTFILDGSQRSFDSTMSILHYYAELSGLRLNYSKTNVIWLGSKKFSKQVFHYRYKLQWGATKFCLLGIKFNTNLKEMISENFDPKLEEINLLIKVWSKRKLTVFGRIVVLKTLIFSKILHLLSSLPSPPPNVLNELNKTFFKFIWNSKTERIKRDILIKDKMDGGVKMPSIINYNKAMKLTWISRLLNTDQSQWVNVFESDTGLKVKDLFRFGGEYAKTQVVIKNDFWGEVLQYWGEYNKTIPVKNTKNIALSKLWFNNNIQIDKKSVFYQQYAANSIFYINDLLENNHSFYTYNSFITKFNINTNFLEFASLINAVKSFLNRYHLEVGSKILGPVIPFGCDIFMNNKSPNKSIYQNLIKNNVTSSAQAKFIANGFRIEDFEWKYFYTLPFKCTSDTSIHWLQFRIIHRILATNSLLFKIGITESELCTFCNTDKETIEHLFYDCYITKQFITEVCEWLSDNLNYNLVIDRKTMLFGKIPNKSIPTKIFNWFILQCKKFIYSSRMNSKVLNIVYFKNFLANEFHIQKYLLLNLCKYEEYEVHWKIWFDNLF